MKTNAELIRSMSDEELAAMLLRVDGESGFCKSLPECLELVDNDGGVPLQKCEACMLKWLRQPAEEVSA